MFPLHPGPPTINSGQAAWDFAFARVPGRLLQELASVIQLEPPPTRYDLYFHVFGFQVRVHPWFWIVAVLLGIGPEDKELGLAMLVLWVLALFVSLLIHELGHAWVMRQLGQEARVLLYGFGGLAVPRPGRTLPLRWRLRAPWDQVAVSLAGPGAMFLLLLSIWLVLWLAGTPLRFQGGGPLGVHWYFEGIENPRLLILLHYLVVINLFWALFNLLPVYPLDGGQVLQKLLVHWQGERGLLLVFRVSMMVALVAAALLLWRLGFRDGLFPALILGLLAFQNHRLEHQLRKADAGWFHPEDDDSWWRG